MAETTTKKDVATILRELREKPQFKGNHRDFPIIYEDGKLRVYLGDAHEVFIEALETGATMRLNKSHYPGGGLEFTTSSRVEPICSHNMIGWRIHEG